MRLSDIIKHLKGIFESKKKNPVNLANDSNLEPDLKPLMVNDKNTPLQISEDTIDVKGSLKVNGVDVSTEPDDTGSGATQLNELSDVTYSSGDLTISSLDTIVSGALTIDSSDDIELNADGGNIIFKDDTDTMLDIQTTNLKSEVPLLIKESADAIADSAGYGQLWVDTATPNELAFTDDAGTDIIGIGKYHYETKFIGFYAGQAAQYIPMTGYIIEKTTNASNNEFISFVAPYNCTIEKFIYRSEIAQDGTFSLSVLESSDDSEIPFFTIYRKDTTIDIADDTFLDYDLTGPSVGSDYAPLTKGKIYAIYVATPATGFDTNITVVFKTIIVIPYNYKCDV